MWIDCNKQLGVSVILFFVSLSVQAILVEDLYKAQVSVKDQSQVSRQAGVQKALRLVLVKLTGDQYILNRHDMRDLLSQAERYMLQYHYSEKPGSNGVELSALFDKRLLDASLRERGISIWGRERPSVLVWFLILDENGKRLVSMEDKDDYTSILSRRAKSRGIRLIFPFLDLADKSIVKANDVYTRVTDMIVFASERYQADVVLLISLEKVGQEIWQSKWTALVEAKTLEWPVTDTDVAILLDQGTDQLVDVLAGQYIRPVDSGNKGKLSIHVYEVNNLANYYKVSDYLKNLNSVTRLEVRTLTDDEVFFELSSIAGEEAVLKAISLGRILEPLEGAGGLVFRYAGG